MDEPTPPLAIYPEPKPQRPRKSASPEAGLRWMYLMLGCVLGVAAVLAVFRFAATPTERVVYKTIPDHTASVTPVTPITPIQTPVQPNSVVQVKPGGITVPPTGDKPKPGDKPVATPKSGKGTTPFNPFDGSVASAMPPKEISGKISDDGTPLPAVGGHGQVNTEPEATPAGLLVTIRLDISDPSAAVRALESIAAKFGGSGIQYDEAAAKEDPEGAVLFVPAAKAADAEKQIANVGSILVNDKWNGSSGDRLDRIERAADDKLSDLRIKRQELLLKYYEDAPQIKHIDEDTDRIKRCIDAVHAIRPGPNTAVIKIKFVV